MRYTHQVRLGANFIDICDLGEIILREERGRRVTSKQYRAKTSYMDKRKLLFLRGKTYLYAAIFLLRLPPVSSRRYLMRINEHSLYN